jgi:acetyltransferase-like isoleucine patch superfamily enzyme
MTKPEIEKIFRYAKQAILDPPSAYAWICALLRGTLCVLFYRLGRSRVHIMLPFFAYSRVHISGEGSVFIDRFCSVHRNSFEGLTIVLLSPDSKVRIGRKCSLGGLTIRCRHSVTIGDQTMTANSLIQDCLFVERELPVREEIREFVKEGPIRIDRNTWIGGQVCIIGRNVIGSDSVLSWGAVCYGADVDEYHLAYGSPIFNPISIAAIARLTE